jgi:DNA-binding transcriptional regulator YhcF (GntR family)
MAEDSASKHTGRPRKPVDLLTLERLAEIHCTMKEMASVFGVSVDTLERNYADIIEKGREEGKASIRRMLFEHGRKGNSTALKYLIHNVLKERVEEVVEKDDTQLKILIARLESLSSESILKLVKSADEKKVS